MKNPLVLLRALNCKRTTAPNTGKVKGHGSPVKFNIAPLSEIIAYKDKIFN